MWVDEVPPEAPPAGEGGKGYVIRPGDLLSVRVVGQDGLSSRARVREDGKVTLPFLNDVEVANYTPTVLAQQLESRLKEFIVRPVVAVALEELRSLMVPVVGEVARPGLVALAPGAGVLSAIAASGGPTEYARRDAIFVLRPGSPPQRIRFRYEALSRAEGKAGSFQLREGDTVVVE